MSRVSLAFFVFRVLIALSTKLLQGQSFPLPGFSDLGRLIIP
jgi:hypothetical protein